MGCGGMLMLLAVLGILFVLDDLGEIELTPWKFRTYKKGDWVCINNIHDFLFQMTGIARSDPRYKMQYEGVLIYPPEPWLEFGELPSSFENLNDEYGDGYVVELARKNSDIWIRTNSKSLIILAVADETYSVLSSHPIDKSGYVYADVYVKDVFEFANGDVLGMNYPFGYHTVWETALPLFSTYNEENHTFEFLDIGLDFTAEEISFSWDGLIPRRGAIVTYNENELWIYQQKHGLYRFDTTTDELIHFDIDNDQNIQTIDPSPGGKLLFRREEKSGWELYPGELLLYDPITQTHEEVNVPDPHWPDYGKLLYTQSGDLWLGIHGYRSKDGEWNLQNPRRKAYIDLGRSTGRFNWSHPNLMLQSSNGYLWYSNNSGDFLGVDGTAWYDPNSRTGCWFTTEYGNVVEDHHDNLWMITRNIIYRLPLSLLENQ